LSWSKGGAQPAEARAKDLISRLTLDGLMAEVQVRIGVRGRDRRAVADREISPRQAVRAYHAALGEAKIVPVRSFDDDARITEEVLLPGAVDKAA